MTLAIEDRLAIHELIGLHGHLMDHGEFDRLGELFTPDVVYDVEDFGFGKLHGFAAIAEAAKTLGDANPLAHLVTNVLVTSSEGNEAQVLSKGLGVRADGLCGSVTYRDTVRRTSSGWRISSRQVLVRRKPLQA